MTSKEALAVARVTANLLISKKYEALLSADEDDGCEHTAAGDPLICWHCRRERFLSLTPVIIAMALDAFAAEAVRREREVDVKKP